MDSFLPSLDTATVKLPPDDPVQACTTSPGSFAGGALPLLQARTMPRAMLPLMQPSPPTLRSIFALKTRPVCTVYVMGEDVGSVYDRNWISPILSRAGVGPVAQPTTARTASSVHGNLMGAPPSESSARIAAPDLSIPSTRLDPLVLGA